MHADVRFISLKAEVADVFVPRQCSKASTSDLSEDENARLAWADLIGNRILMLILSDGLVHLRAEVIDLIHFEWESARAINPTLLTLQSCEGLRWFLSSVHISSSLQSRIDDDLVSFILHEDWRLGLSSFLFSFYFLASVWWISHLQHVLVFQS